MPNHSRFLTRSPAFVPNRMSAREEIADLRWSEIDFKDNSLLLPGERTKNHEPLYLPLTDTALNILKSIERRPGNEYVFGTKPNKGLALPRIAKSGGKVPNPKWVLHDIRRTLRSGLGEVGVSREIGERIINHIGKRTEVERTYDKYEYGPQKRDALMRWESHLLNIVTLRALPAITPAPAPAPAPAAPRSWWRRAS